MPKFFAKRLTSGAPPTAPPSMVQTTQSRSIGLRKTHDADVAVASLTAARPFVKRFMAWCANNGNTGPIDWPTLHELSEAFAFESGMRPITERALCRVLTKLRIPKYKRDIKDEERSGLRRRGQSDARRPRVTVYVVPDGELSGIDDDRQLQLFE